MKYISKRFLQPLLVLVVFIAFVALWEFCVWLHDIDNFVLPSIFQIFDRLINLFSPQMLPILWHNYQVTMQEVLVGYSIGIGITLILAPLISLFRFVRMAMMPYIIAFQTIPTVAMAPIILTWYKYSIWANYVIVATVCFFPILLNVIAGLRSAKKEEIQMLKAFGASNWQILWRLRAPSALPYAFTGLSMGIVFAQIGAVVAEFVGGKPEGLAKMMMQYNENFDIASMFAILIILSINGIVLYNIIEYIRRRVVFWT